MLISIRKINHLDIFVCTFKEIKNIHNLDSSYYCMMLLFSSITINRTNNLRNGCLQRTEHQRWKWRISNQATSKVLQNVRNSWMNLQAMKVHYWQQHTVYWNTWWIWGFFTCCMLCDEERRKLPANNMQV